jgi:glycosyltransferase involved in cell wall biosynthesis
MILHECDCFISSSWNEGFGISLAEAKVCGLPIIASDIPGTKDIVDENNALLFNPSDVAELLEKIIAIKTHKELREELINKSLEDPDKFEWEKIELQERKLIERYKQ